MLQYAIQRKDSRGATALIDTFEAMDDRDALRVAQITFERFAEEDLELLHGDHVVKRRKGKPQA